MFGIAPFPRHKRLAKLCRSHLFSIIFCRMNGMCSHVFSTRKVICNRRLSLPTEVRRRCNDWMWRSRRRRRHRDWFHLDGAVDVRCCPPVVEILRRVSPLVTSVQRSTLSEIEVPALRTRLHHLFVQLLQQPDVLSCVRGPSKQAPTNGTRLTSASFDCQYIHVATEQGHASDGDSRVLSSFRSTKTEFRSS